MPRFLVSDGQSFPHGFQRLFPAEAACAAYLDERRSARCDRSCLVLMGPHWSGGGRAVPAAQIVLASCAAASAAADTGLTVGLNSVMAPLARRDVFWSAWLVAKQRIGIVADSATELCLSRSMTAISKLTKSQRGDARFSPASFEQRDRPSACYRRGNDQNPLGGIATCARMTGSAAGPFRRHVEVDETGLPAGRAAKARGCPR